MDFETAASADYSTAFKVVNLIVATITVLSGLSQIPLGIGYFFQGIYVAAIGGLIGYLEFKIPPQLYAYCSSMFTLLGRGLIYILIGLLISHDSIFRIIPGFLVFAIGVSFIILEFVPSIAPPENMQGEQRISSDDLEDVI